MGNVYGGSGVGVKRSVMKRLKGLRSPDEGELRDYGDEKNITLGTLEFANTTRA